MRKPASGCARSLVLIQTLCQPGRRYVPVSTAVFAVSLASAASASAAAMPSVMPLNDFSA